MTYLERTVDDDDDDDWSWERGEGAHVQLSSQTKHKCEESTVADEFIINDVAFATVRREEASV